MATLKSKVPSDPLIGRYFRSKVRSTLPDGKEKTSVAWIGFVIGSPQPGYYVVQLMDWMTAKPCVERLVRIEDMIIWEFYRNMKELRAEVCPGMEED